MLLYHPRPLERVPRGQLKAAEYLLERGADLNWVGWGDLTPLDEARRNGASDVVEWLEDSAPSRPRS